MRIRTLIITLLIGSLSNISLAAGEAAKVEQPSVEKSSEIDLKYPELLVAPPASKRLESEYANEKKAGIERYLPTLASSTMTILSAMMLSGEDASTLPTETQDSIKGAALASMLIGGAWIGLDLYLNSTYKPYEAGVKAMGPANKSATQLETLSRERAAEEALYNAGDFNQKLKWLSVATNLAGSGLVLSMANKFPNSSTSKATIVSAISIIGAFAPVMFESPWEKTANYHREYKKKIYGPITGITLIPSHNELVPAYSLSYQF